MEDEEYYQKNDVPDLYNILGLTIDVCKSKDCDKIIQKAYNQKIKRCHPDKYPGRADMIELFQLLTETYEILKNEKQREQYNSKLKYSKRSTNDFYSLKKGALNYLKPSDELKKASEKDLENFKIEMENLDKKHNFNRNIIKDKITEDETTKRMRELAAFREEQDKELMPENIFHNKTFDSKKFNALFDKYHKESDTTMIERKVPSAWNDGNDSSSSYGNFNMNNVDLYEEGDMYGEIYGENFNKIEPSRPIKKFTAKDIDEAGEANYVTDYNHIDENYYADIKKKLQEREMSTNQYNSMEFKDYSRDTLGYGIHDKLGLKFDDVLCLDDNETIKKKYDRLVAKKRGGQ